MPQPFQRLQPLARRVTAGQGNAYGQAVALQQWFTRPGNFTYSLTRPQPHGRRSADQLSSPRPGAATASSSRFAMAVMARLVGIPSRVVVGYTQGVYQEMAPGRCGPATRTHGRSSTSRVQAGCGSSRPPPAIAGQGQATASAPAYSFPPLSSVAPAPQPTSSTLAPGPSPVPSRPGGRPRRSCGSSAAPVAAGAHWRRPPLGRAADRPGGAGGGRGDAIGGPVRHPAPPVVQGG